MSELKPDPKLRLPTDGDQTAKNFQRKRNFAEDKSRRIEDRQQRWILTIIMVLVGIGAAVYLAITLSQP